MTHHCGDCGRLEGQLHIAGCDIERCPKCHGQLLSCACDFPMIFGEQNFFFDKNRKKYIRFKVAKSVDEDFDM